MAKEQYTPMDHKERRKRILRVLRRRKNPMAVQDLIEQAGLSTVSPASIYNDLRQLRATNQVASESWGKYTAVRE